MSGVPVDSITTLTTDESAARGWLTVNDFQFNVQFEDGTDPDEEGKQQPISCSPKANNMSVSSYEAMQSLSEVPTPSEDDEFSLVQQCPEEAVSVSSHSDQTSSPPTPASPAGLSLEDCPSSQTPTKAPLPSDLATGLERYGGEELSDDGSQEITCFAEQVKVPEVHDRARKESPQDGSPTPQNTTMVDGEADGAVSRSILQEDYQDYAVNKPKEHSPCEQLPKKVRSSDSSFEHERAKGAASGSSGLTSDQDSDESSPHSSFSPEAAILQETMLANTVTDGGKCSGCEGDGDQEHRASTSPTDLPDTQHPRAIDVIDLTGDSNATRDAYITAKARDSAVRGESACASARSSREVTDGPRSSAIDAIVLTAESEPACAKDTHPNAREDGTHDHGALPRAARRLRSTAPSDKGTVDSGVKKRVYDGSWHEDIDTTKDEDLQRAIQEEPSVHSYVSEDDPDYRPRGKCSKSKRRRVQQARRDSAKAPSSKRFGPGEDELKKHLSILEESIREIQESMEAIRGTSSTLRELRRRETSIRP